MLARCVNGKHAASRIPPIVAFVPWLPRVQLRGSFDHVFAIKSVSYLAPGTLFRATNGTPDVGNDFPLSASRSFTNRNRSTA